MTQCADGVLAMLAMVPRPRNGWVATARRIQITWYRRLMLTAP